MSMKRLFCTTALAATLLLGQVTSVEARAADDVYTFSIAARPLDEALAEFGRTTGRQLLFAPDLVAGHRAPAVVGDRSADAALSALLAGSGLSWRTTRSGAIMIVQEAARPQGPEDVASPPTLDEVVVTGSNIRGVAPVGASLVVLDGRAIAQTGAATVSQALATLPQNSGGGNNEGTVGVPGGAGGNVGYGSSPNLRGLGSSSTLVLLNGRRMAPAAFGQFVDVSQIPLGAVERIEVLPDGASATYGSDAVGGVVNVILKRRYRGAETTASAGASTHGDAHEYRFNQAFGVDGARGGFLVDYEYYHRDALDADERSYSAGARRLDLLPRQESHAVMANGRLELSAGAEAWATGLGSVREARQRTVYGQPTPETAQGSLAGGVDLELGGSWSAAGSALFGQSRAKYEATGPTSPRLNVQSDVWSFDLKADGEILDLPAGAAKFAVGASVRGDRFQDVGGGGEAQSRTVQAVFVEAHLPLVDAETSRPGVQRLDVSLAARHERYSDFGGTTNPKIGVLWSPIGGVNLRASWGTSFRAPLLNDLSSAPNATVLIDLPNPTAPSGTSLVMFQQGGNPTLGPETADTWSVGVELEPAKVPGLRASLSVFDIDYRDRIATAAPGGEILGILNRASIYRDQLTALPTAAQVLAYQAASPQFVNLHGPFAAPEVEFLFDRRLTNLSRQHVQGLDGAIDYRTTRPSGDWQVNVAATYLLRFEDQISAAAPVVSTLATAYHQPRLRGRAVVGWSRDAWNASATLNHTSEFSDPSVVPAARVKSWTTADAQLGYQPEYGALSPLRLTLTVRNLFDQDPPFLRSPLALYAEGYDPTNANPLGRYVTVAVTKTW